MNEQTQYKPGNREKLPDTATKRAGRQRDDGKDGRAHDMWFLAAQALCMLSRGGRGSGCTISVVAAGISILGKKNVALRDMSTNKSRYSAVWSGKRLARRTDSGVIAVCWEE